MAVMLVARRKRKEVFSVDFNCVRQFIIQKKTKKKHVRTSLNIDLKFEETKQS